MRYIVIAQVLLAGTTAALYSIPGISESIAALYGGAIAVGNGLLLARRAAAAARKLEPDAGSDARAMYVGAIERFVFTLVALGLGMGWLHLMPVPMLVAFAVTHLGYPIGNRWAVTAANRR